MKKYDYRATLLKKIEDLPDQVFMRSDLTSDLSSTAQSRLSRALKAFVHEGHVIKIGHALYAKARVVEFNNEKRTLLKKPFAAVATEALNKLGVKWEYGEAIQEYNRGDTQQIPIHFAVRLKSRYRGHLTNGQRNLEFEGGINAR